MDPTGKLSKSATARSRRDRFAERVSQLVAQSKGSKKQVETVAVSTATTAPIAVAPKKKFHRRRCENCNVLYQPTRKNQRFCAKNKGQCRKEFHRYGSSYGPLKTGLEKAIEKKYAGLRAQVLDRLRIAADCLARIEVRIVRIEKLCPGVIGQNDYDREMGAHVEPAKFDARSR